MQLLRFLIIYVFLLVFSSFKVEAEPFYWKVKTFQNVKVRIVTAFDFEEKNKAFIFGELAAELAQRLHYSEPILLDFNHYWIEKDSINAYAINFDKGEMKSPSPYYEEYELSKDGIRICQSGKFFNAKETLQLLEYAIANIDKLKKTKNTEQFGIADFNDKIFSRSLSEDVKMTLSKKVYPLIDEKERNNRGSIFYYFQNNEYVIYYQDPITEQTDELIKLQNVYQLNNFIVFDTDRTFYYISPSFISTKQTLFIPSTVIAPILVKYIDSNLYSIKCCTNTVSLYLPHSNKLIQNVYTWADISKQK